MTYIAPRASMRPIGRQPFRPGQWQGFKGVSRNTTYIQNNFFGSSYNSGMNYGNYNNTCCDNGPSKFTKWMMGIGIGTTLLGGILKLFGVGGNKENGAIEGEQEPEDKTRQKDADTVIDNSSVKSEKAKGESVKVDTPPAEPAENGGKNKINWQNGDNMVCTDASGKTQDITGKLTLGDNGNPPQSFTITDSTSGKENVYKYELQSNNEGEKPVYKCVSRNGEPVTSDNAYTLENENGKPKLVQHENQRNFKAGLTFGSIAAGGGNKPGFSKTMIINTSVGPATITVTANSQKELDEKVAEREKESAKWAPKQENKPAAQGGATPSAPSPEAPAYENPWSSFANGTAMGTMPWATTGTQGKSTTAAPQQQSSQATQQLNTNLASSTLSADRKKAATEALGRVNNSKLPEAQKEALREKLADVTKGLQAQNKFNQVITEVNQAVQA